MWLSTDTTEVDDEKVITARSIVEQESPWFDGHFPDDPVLPAIAQLDLVSKVITEAMAGELVLHSLSRIKFKKIIRPGDILDIRAVPAKTEHHYSFSICNEQQEVCSGKLVLTPKQEQ
jgi:3-hydroxymyristoyl/3-hydroxydecanoyl-(acyl carrier protein) dehydratase